jgi:hypothetical protein
MNKNFNNGLSVKQVQNILANKRKLYLTINDIRANKLANMSWFGLQWLKLKQKWNYTKLSLRGFVVRICFKIIQLLSK